MSSFIDFINQWVAEHGGAVLHKKHVAILKDTATLFEKQKALLESELRALKTENDALKADNINLQKEKVQLKEKLKAYEQPSHDNLPDEQIKILVLLKKSGINEDKIIAAFDRDGEAVRYDLEELRAANLLECETMLGITFVSLTQDGRRYLKNKELLK